MTRHILLPFIEPIAGDAELASNLGSRALPGMVTILAWRSCDHLEPVFEGDILSTELTAGPTLPLDHPGAALVDLRAIVHADRGSKDPPAAVLDWRFVAVVA